MIGIKKYNSVTAEYQFSKKLLENLNLSQNLEQKNREELFIKDICKRIKAYISSIVYSKKLNYKYSTISISILVLSQIFLLPFKFYVCVQN